VDEISRIQSESHTCQGVYCSDCLAEHLEDNNTCPIHQDVVLFHMAPKPVFVSGERKVIDTLDQVDDKHRAVDFVLDLLFATKALYENESIFESDIDEKINEALLHSAKRHNCKHGLLIKAVHWAAVSAVAKEMVEMHYKTEGKAELDVLAKSSNWMAKMAKAVGREKWDR